MLSAVLQKNLEDRGRNWRRQRTLKIILNWSPFLKLLISRAFTSVSPTESWECSHSLPDWQKRIEQKGLRQMSFDHGARDLDWLLCSQDR